MWPFKKKKNQISVTVEAVHNANNYDPWEGNNSNSIFSNVNFLNSVDGKPLGKNNDSYPRKCSYLFDIPSPLMKHKELIGDGYLQAAPLEVALQKAKISELKEILSKHNIPIKGRKNDLVQSVLDNVPREDVNVQEIYVLSDKGAQFVNQHQHYIEISNYLINHDVTLEEYEEIKSKQPYLKVKDAVWQIYNKKAMEYSANGNYGLLRCIEIFRYELLLSEEKFTDALYHLIVAYYYDLSGIGYNHTIAPFESIVDKSNVLVSCFSKLKDYYTPSLVERCYSRIDVPFRYFDCTTFKRIMDDIMRDGEVDIEKYKYKAAKLVRRRK